MLYRGNDRRRLAQCRETARAAGVPLIAVNDVLYHHSDRRQLQDVVTCIREHLTIDKAGRRLAGQCRAPSEGPAEMARLFRDAPEAIEETSALDAALTFSLDQLRYEYPEESRAGFATPQDALVHLAWEGAATRYPDGIPDSVRHTLEHELALIAKLDYAPYFLTVHHIVDLRPQPEHSLSGSRVGGELGGLLLPAHHRCRSARRAPAVRALHLVGSRRAARHRRRFRARAARGGDPAHLPALRTRPYRHRRHRHLLSRPVRDPRGRQGFRPVGGHDRRPFLLDLGHGRRGGARRRARARRHRPAKLHACRGCVRWSPRFSPSRAISPSTSAASSLPAAGSTRSCRSGTAPWRIAPSWNGTRTISMRSASSRSTCSGSACSPACARRSSSPKSTMAPFRTPRQVDGTGRASSPCRRYRRKTPPFTACCNGPIRSACSRSKAARRCRCCRASSRRNSTISSSRSRSCGRVRSRATWCIPICAGGRAWSR